MRPSTPFYRELQGRVSALGGLHNAHLHLDRAGTLDEARRLLDPDTASLSSSLSLPAKHSLIPTIHASREFGPGRLEERVAEYLEIMAECGTRQVDTLVDAGLELGGLEALDAFERLRERFRSRLELRIGAYNPLGFRDDEPERWKLFVEAARRADFLGSLPERDDRRRSPGHVGFDEHCRRLLGLATELGKSLHVHVDQVNHPLENGTERLLRVADEIGFPGEPRLWLIHAISPSTYDEPRFEALLRRLVERDVGVITCPSAAISMRQCRTVSTPTFNSIARVLEMSAAGVQVRVGSDNVCDMTSPAGSPDLVDEVFVLANAIRYYDVDFLAKLAAGVRLDRDDRDRLVRHLEADRDEVARTLDLLGGESS